ncbi:MAG: Low temperature requirement protein LtrA, partial [Jatrophihabitantaceae bacterium]|nr:Low temperature requirement protein LtrA [Jatrophihabitantaceae bacterium]
PAAPTAKASPARPWHRVMAPRDPDEGHRASTPLELLFDLSFVVAVSFAAIGLHHGIAAGDTGGAVGSYLMAFFAIWWAWMNFTWFASAYDTDDGIYRFTVLVQIAGALVLAAGIPGAFDGSYAVVVVGYLIMRLAGVSQWIRAAISDPAHRPTTTRYAIGISIVQIGWIAWLAVPDGGPGIAVYVLLVLSEIAVPTWAERRTTTPFHTEHIAERYGLFTIIVLGEALIGATAAVQAGMSEGGHAARLLTAAVSGLVIVFALWWLYFDTPAHVLLTSLNQSLKWGYGHYLIFGSAAAIGAGFEVLVDDVLSGGSAEESGGSHAVAGLAAASEAAHGPSEMAVGYAMVGPVAIFLAVMWFLQVLPPLSGRSDAARGAIPVASVLIALSPLVLGPVAAVVVAATACLALVAVASTFG